MIASNLLLLSVQHQLPTLDIYFSCKGMLQQLKYLISGCNIFWKVLVQNNRFEITPHPLFSHGPYSFQLTNIAIHMLNFCISYMCFYINKGCCEFGHLCTCLDWCPKNIWPIDVYVACPCMKNSKYIYAHAQKPLIC